MPEHGQRFIHTDHGGLADAPREPLHFHFDVADGDLFGRDTGREVVKMPGIGIALGGQHAQHTANVLEVFIRIPAAAHAVDIELEGFVGQAGFVKDGHTVFDSGLRLKFGRGADDLHSGFCESAIGRIRRFGVIDHAGDNDGG